MSTKKHFTLDYAKVRKAEFIITSLQNPRRQRIIDLLEDHGDLKASEIQTHLNLDSNTTLHHLANLRRAGVVEVIRCSEGVFYRLVNQRLAQITGAVARFLEKFEVPVCV